MATTIPVARRREIFAALVAAQDTGMGVAPSRQKVAHDHGLSPKQVEKIEKEGMEADWPPFDA